MEWVYGIVMDKGLIEIQTVKQNELQDAWQVFLSNYNDYIERYNEGVPLTSRMSFEDFCSIYSEDYVDFYFVIYDSRIIGTFYVKNFDDGKKNLARFWMTPEFVIDGIVPTVIKRFEERYCDATGWIIGSCLINRADIEECKKDGWNVNSSIERMSDGTISACLVKDPC